MSVSSDPVEEVDYRARAFVNGFVDEVKNGERTGKKIVHTAHWAPAFRDHPMVERAEREGWGADLRSHCVRAVMAAMFAGRPHHVIESLMPDGKWVEHISIRAERFAAANEWRDAIIEKHGSLERFLARSKKSDTTARPLGSIAIPGFTELVRNSPNRHLHRTKDGALSDVSRRMTGEGE